MDARNLRWRLIGVVLTIFLLGGCGNPTPTRESPTATPTPAPPTLTPIPPTPTPVPPAPQPPTSASTLAIDTIVREKDGMVMVYVPGGTFEMGSTGFGRDEQPLHAVTLDSFWIDQTEVTNAQFARCVAASVCSPPSRSISFRRDSYYGDSQYDDYPVIYISWNDATTYCQWAGGQLPTEAQWEYAARGPDSSVYPWGDSPPNGTLLNLDANMYDTTRVGSYPSGASWCGALDMAGNVTEWVNDWYADDYYAASPEKNPTGPEAGSIKVWRGGSFYVLEDQDFIPSARRLGRTPGERTDGVGFRCVVASASSP